MNETNETTTAAVPQAAPPPVYLNYDQMRANFEKLRLQRYRVWNASRQYLHRRDSGGYHLVAYKNDASVFTLGNAEYWLRSNPEYTYELEDQALAATIAALPIPKCDPVKVLGIELIAMIQAQPNNPTFRAMVMSVAKQMPPEGLTGDQIVEWVKFNCDPTSTRDSTQLGTAAQARRLPGLSFDLNYEDVESGTCTYSVRRYGEGSVTINRDDILELVDQNTNDLDGVIDGIEDMVSEDAYEDPPTMEWDNEDGASYDNHESQDHQEDRWTYQDSANRRRERIIEYLRDNLTLEQLNELAL